MLDPAPAFDIAVESATDNFDIEALHAASFGPGRFARAAFRLREQGPHDLNLSFVARAGGEGSLVGSVRLTWVTTGADRPKGLLLGPLAVMPVWKNKGAGRALMRHALARAAETDAAYVLLVGDAPYYAPFGFVPVAPGRITMPGPVDPRRLLMVALLGDAPQHVSGMVRHADWD